MPPSLSLYEDQLKTSLISKTLNYILIHMISVIKYVKLFYCKWLKTQLIVINCNFLISYSKNKKKYKYSSKDYL